MIDVTTTLALLNTPILTADGEYSLESLTLSEARAIIECADGDILSAIGHEATAQIMTDLLGIEVPVNRIQFEQQAGQAAIVFRLNARQPEGKVLTRDELEQIGYSFKLLIRKK